MTRILIADDNAINRKLLSWQLETLGFACEGAVCGQAAIDVCAESDFDLIFMDVNLGDMDGYQVTRTLRAREQARRTPIVAVTAHVGREERERCLASGMDDFLSKPITLGPLAQLLVRWGVHGYDHGHDHGDDRGDDHGHDGPDAAPAAESDRGERASGSDSEQGPWLEERAVTWLRKLEQGSAHAGLAREIVEDFLDRAPAHARRLRAAVGAGDAEERAKMCFALNKNCLGIGALRLANLVDGTQSGGEVWLAAVERILAATSDEIRREFM